MNGKEKTVSELCLEALELAKKAEADKGKHTWESYRNAYGNHFFNFAFNHIKQIAERCLELESQNKSQGMELARQKAVDALKSISEAESCHNCDWCAACGHGVHYTKQEALGALKEIGELK